MKYWIMGIIVIGLVMYMLWRKFKKKDENISNIAVFTLGSTLIVDAGGNNFDWVLKLIAIIMNRDYTLEITQDFNIPYFIFGVTLILLSIVLTYYKKTNVKVLNINGYFKRNIEDYIKKSEDLRNDIREYEVNFVDIYQKIFKKSLDNESYECIIEKIEEDVNTFKNCSREGKRGYTGIAPIPLIMYAGTFLEREKIDEYYEFDKKETNTYYKLKNKRFEIYPKLKIGQDINSLDRNKKEIVIAISITAKITDEQLDQFKEKCNIINIEVDNPSDNTIKSQKQLIDYTNTIFNIIQTIFENFSKIESIHIVCSSQSCLALEIGKRSVDDTRLPQIISYQYEAQSDIKYPWGIRINGKNKGELIVANRRYELNNV